MILHLRSALRQFRRFWKSALCIVLGSSIGVAAVVLTLGTALDIMLRTVEIVPPDAQSTAVHSLSGRGIKTAELTEALKDIPHLAGIILDQPFNLKRADGREGTVISVDVRGPIWHPPLLAGRFLTPADRSGGTVPAIVMGRAIAEDWFAHEQAVGRAVSLTVDGQIIAFRVAGVIGVAGRLTPWDHQLVIPSTYDVGRTVNSFQVKADSPQNLGAVLTAVETALKQTAPQLNLNVSPVHSNPDQTEVRLAQVAGVLSLLVVTVAAVNCGNLAGFWAHRRRREIGIRQALGATQASVIAMVLGEVMLLNLLGAVLGLAVYGVLYYSKWIPIALTFMWTHVLIGVASACVSGFLAGLVPAVIVAQMDPTEAVRTE